MNSQFGDAGGPEIWNPNIFAKATDRAEQPIYGRILNFG